MNMKIIKLLITFTVGSLVFFSCEKYEEYVKDFDYTSVYFASQKPLRTIIADGDMQFKIGVVLGGKRENNQVETVAFRIDTSLFSDSVRWGKDATTMGLLSGFELLPEAYYTLSNNTTFTIPKGDILGEVTVTLNQELFTADTLSLMPYYALPLIIYETSADSILQGEYDDLGNAIIPAKDFSVIVIKYVDEEEGNYYHKGVDHTYNGSSLVSTTSYSFKDLSKNDTWTLSTTAIGEYATSGIADKEGSHSMKLVVNNDNTVTIKNVTTSPINNIVGGNSTYDVASRTFYLNYQYDASGNTHKITDTLVFRDFRLQYEEWTD